jgi:probable rRNA maturation factor
VAEHVRAPAHTDSAALARFALDALDALGRRSAELSVLLCDDRFIRDLNLRFRGIDAPTDVLSFEQDRRTVGHLQTVGHGPVLGDVVISLDTARRQARGRSVPESAELRELLLHGILHLLGREHGDGEVADEPMLREQHRLLERLS